MDTPAADDIQFLNAMHAGDPDAAESSSSSSTPNFRGSYSLTLFSLAGEIVVFALVLLLLLPRLLIESLNKAAD
jgi:hypothetical protein